MEHNDNLEFKGHIGVLEKVCSFYWRQSEADGAVGWEWGWGWGSTCTEWQESMRTYQVSRSASIEGSVSCGHLVLTPMPSRKLIMFLSSTSWKIFEPVPCNVLFLHSPCGVGFCWFQPAGLWLGWGWGRKPWGCEFSLQWLCHSLLRG